MQLPDNCSINSIENYVYNILGRIKTHTHKIIIKVQIHIGHENCLVLGVIFGH